MCGYLCKHVRTRAAAAAAAAPVGPTAVPGWVLRVNRRGSNRRIVRHPRLDCDMVNFIAAGRNGGAALLFPPYNNFEHIRSLGGILALEMGFEKKL